MFIAQCKSSSHEIKWARSQELEFPEIAKDLAFYAEDLASALTSGYNDRVIRPASYLHTSILTSFGCPWGDEEPLFFKDSVGLPEILERMNGRLAGPVPWLDKFLDAVNADNSYLPGYDEIMAQLEERIIYHQDECTIRKKDEPQALEFLPLVPNDKMLIHTTGFYFRKQALSDRIRDTNIIGNDGEYALTYLKSPDLADSGIVGRGDFDIKIDLQIDTRILTQFRNIFSDWEGVAVAEECGSTFAVFGGIPAQSVVGFKLRPDGPLGS